MQGHSRTSKDEFLTPCFKNAGTDQAGFISDVGCSQKFLNRNTPTNAPLLFQNHIKVRKKELYPVFIKVLKSGTESVFSVQCREDHDPGHAEGKPSSA